MKTILRSIESQCKAAAESKRSVAALSTEEKNAALEAMRAAILIGQETIIEENKKDLDYGRSQGLSTALIDRLTLTESRIKGIADSLQVIRDLNDPLGEVIKDWVLPNGLKVSKVRVPLGVIGIIYEARPNVTADAIGLAIKSGNCVVLRGSATAYHSNKIISDILRTAAEAHGVPGQAIQLLDNVEREGVLEFVRMKQHLDLVIPRGGASLINTVVENATVPAIETGTGVCHVYIDKTAPKEKAIAIAVNAKVQRPSVCNACETILVHTSRAEDLLPDLISQLQENEVVLRVCERTKALFPDLALATQEDWDTEYLDLIVSLRIVSSVSEAIDHISQHGTMHSEAILSEDQSAIDQFVRDVDAAAVLVNTSTRFTDGGEFGFGAEMGISTQKMHARGPLGLPELTTYKYVVVGNGQLRS